MKSYIFPGIATMLCAVLASCYPYPEDQQKKPTEKIQQSPAEEAKAKEEELRKKQEEELKQSQQNQTTDPQPLPETTTQTTPPATTPTRTDYPFANKVPGKDGFVFSPYNNKVVDVREIPSGTLVQDPTYAASEKKYFRVP